MHMAGRPNDPELKDREIGGGEWFLQAAVPAEEQCEDFLDLDLVRVVVLWPHQSWCGHAGHH